MKTVPAISRCLLLVLFLACSCATGIAQEQYYDVIRQVDDGLLADGTRFHFWEQETRYMHTYHVACDHPEASDRNPGTEQEPFLTISRAASILRPGERVVIHGGLYREVIHPACGGSGPAGMISYEAAPGEPVVVSGSIVLEDRWEPGKGWNYGSADADRPDTVWQYDLPGKVMDGYNPFGMMNILHDREYLQVQKVKMEAHFKRRGMLFLDGVPLKQVMKPVELMPEKAGAFWVEHNGLRIHVRFPEGTGPRDHLVEAAIREQLFVPWSYGTGYIRIRGITFMHAANGFPVPQRGAVSSNRGNHWIIEDCTIEQVNALGVDLGNEMWHTEDQEGIGFHIFRRNTVRRCGIAGLEAMRAPGLLIEDNLFGDIGWQDAEHGWESGAIKLHRARDCLIRRNLFRRIHYAPGIWLDYRANDNCRITRNVFTDVITARGCIYVEVSRNHCLIDHNIFHKTRSQYWISGDYGAGGSALYTDGSDSIDFQYNLTMDIENTGYGSYLNAERIVGMRGGYTRFHRVRHNIFAECGKHAIEFPNRYNESDYNLFSDVNPGYLKMALPAPALLLDLEAWRIAFGWEKNGRLVHIRPVLDSNTLEFSMTVGDEEELTGVEAGPFREIRDYSGILLDPRKIDR
ncbi:MAG: right-handed parallel beta-helix repeat-containing protein [Bacteroidales bacterium]